MRMFRTFFFASPGIILLLESSLLSNAFLQAQNVPNGWRLRHLRQTPPTNLQHSSDSLAVFKGMDPRETDVMMTVEKVHILSFWA